MAIEPWTANREWSTQTTGIQNNSKDVSNSSSFVSLLASCRLHALEPWTYLRDLFCLLSDWPHHRVFELASVAWQQTLQQPDTQEQLAVNPFRAATLALGQPHADNS